MIARGDINMRYILCLAIMAIMMTLSGCATPSYNGEGGYWESFGNYTSYYYNDDDDAYHSQNKAVMVNTDWNNEDAERQYREQERQEYREQYYANQRYYRRYEEYRNNEEYQDNEDDDR